MTARMTITAYVDCRGPLWDGRAETDITEYVDKVAKAVADEAERMLAATPMDRSGRASGQFQAHLQVIRRDLGYSVPGATDKGETWAPWLEGTSKRNKNTRFKGYHLFRYTRKQLENGKAEEIAEGLLPELVEKLGGE